MARNLATYSDNAQAVQATAPEESRAMGAADRPDAVKSGIVRSASSRAADALSEPARSQASAGRGSNSSHGDARGAPSGKSSPSGKQVGQSVPANVTGPDTGAVSAKATQSKLNLKRAIANEAVEQLDDSEELEGVADMHRTGRSARSLISRRRARASKPSPTGKGGKANAKAEQAAKAKEANAERMHRAALAKAQESTAATGVNAAGAAAATAAEGGTATVVGGIASALAPVAGVIAGIAAFVICVLAVSQVISALFGFWENEAAKQSMEGLPPFITYEMVEAALECQEEYGHPAGCTLAQIIVESGQGDTMSRLATRDHNLFGMKWASSFGGCNEVSGKSAWQTNEEVNGSTVTITAYFTVFKSDVDCIRFRSRVFLQSSTYAGNAKIQEAISQHDSDLMAEGLKEAGWATSSSYVESLKSVMDTYNLRRFDSMTVEDLKAAAASGSTIVQAAYSQLGVPYVWGGSTPGVGLDCSGLTQYCYRQAGISISHYTEDQYAELRHIPLSQAQPGDILYKPGHVAIYIGDGKYIHEPQTGDVCRIASGIDYFTCALRAG
jgi:peptidoglycan DL-endopeptidase CwlO